MSGWCGGLDCQPLFGSAEALDPTLCHCFFVIRRSEAYARWPRPLVAPFLRVMGMSRSTVGSIDEEVDQAEENLGRADRFEGDRQTAVLREYATGWGLVGIISMISTTVWVLVAAKLTDGLAIPGAVVGAYVYGASGTEGMLLWRSYRRVQDLAYGRERDRLFPPIWLSLVGGLPAGVIAYALAVSYHPR